ncbi:MAG: hypothetical protein GY778_28065 [bacterium]|nr:hypothetical protein [bacterium]
MNSGPKNPDAEQQEPSGQLGINIADLTTRCRWSARLWLLCGLGVAMAAAAVRAEPPPLNLTLKLDRGGEVFGDVLEATDDLIVLDYRGDVCAFAYDELTVGSAYQARKRLLIQRRGRAKDLTGEDHFRLGAYALDRDRPALANQEFRVAQRLKPDLADRVAAAREAYHDRRRARRPASEPSALDTLPSTTRPKATLPGLVDTVRPTSDEDRQEIIEVYKRFGKSVKEAINPDLVLIETDHFLIWTDWQRHRREPLARWCEAVYSAVATQFGLDPEGNVFLGKCPVFCFRSKARFLRFGRTYDGWKISSANGYTRTSPAGHAHVVIYRRGATPQDLDRFAGTLVHECVHAIVHRYQRVGHVGGWVGEGLAQFMAEQVLQERCLYGEAADLVARQYALKEISVWDLLHTTGLPKPHEYPVAHSLVGFLIERDATALTGFVTLLKRGLSIEQALRRSYDGLTFDGLTEAWRDHHRRSPTGDPFSPE